MRTQAELLHEMACNTHTLWSESFVAEVNAAFGTGLQARTYEPDGGPKGLTTNSGHAERGLACFTLAPLLCSALGVRYADKLGRGFQVRACVEALREAGYGK